MNTCMLRCLFLLSSFCIPAQVSQYKTSEMMFGHKLRIYIEKFCSQLQTMCYRRFETLNNGDKNLK